MVRRMLGLPVCHGRPDKCSRPSGRRATWTGVRASSTAAPSSTPEAPKTIAPYSRHVSDPSPPGRNTGKPPRRGSAARRPRGRTRLRSALVEECTAVCTRLAVSTRWARGASQGEQANQQRQTDARTWSSRRRPPRPPEHGPRRRASPGPDGPGSPSDRCARSGSPDGPRRSGSPRPGGPRSPACRRGRSGSRRSGSAGPGAPASPACRRGRSRSPYGQRRPKSPGPGRSRSLAW